MKSLFAICCQRRICVSLLSPQFLRSLHDEQYSRRRLRIRFVSFPFVTAVAYVHLNKSKTIFPHLVFGPGFGRPEFIWRPLLPKSWTQKKTFQFQFVFNKNTVLAWGFQGLIQQIASEVEREGNACLYSLNNNSPDFGPGPVDNSHRPCLWQPGRSRDVRVEWTPGVC